jgi:ribokinase
MIVVFGSINVDVLMRVPRHPSPGETILGDECLLRPGGKGANQAVAASRSGASVLMFGAVGDDTFGADMRLNLTNRNVDASGVQQAPGQMTGCATIVIDHKGQNAICVAPGANRAVRADLVPEDALTPTTTVICQMEIPARENWALLRRARARGATTILNLAPATKLDDEVIAAIREWVDFLIVNETEARLVATSLSRCAITPEEDAMTVSEALQVSTIMTLGAAGAVAIWGREVTRVDALHVDVVDTTGAGDTFTGAFAAALQRGSTISEALTDAAAAGSLSCQRVGAQESMPDYPSIVAARQRRR